jgi:hypothetical protein
MSEADVNAAGGQPRDYGVFDADLAGKALDMALLRRLFHWLRPHRRTLAISGVLIVAASVLAIAMPVIVSRVVIDGLLAVHPAGAIAGSRPDAAG